MGRDTTSARSGLLHDRQQAFEDEALVHLDSLYHVAYRLGRSRSEAEDLVQETMLKAFQSFHQYDRGTNCRAWLLTILHHTFLNRLKRTGREFLEPDGQLPEPGEGRWEYSSAIYNPEEAFFQSFMDPDVERALEALPAPFREVVVLADLEECSYKEIAQIVGCPTGTVMSRLYRGRQLLKQALLERARQRGYIRG
ncbi:MAG: sigma-70 family RNA polymerase sigma factor [Candidatus Rokubacteria bacterium]|nr:sigma-70 family RNA polymerase sigma factor [Candidatus Rokubacteria bacterium]